MENTMRRFGGALAVKTCTALLAILAPCLTGGTASRAQELIPWRQGAVAPKGDAGFWWMTAEGGFAKQQGPTCAWSRSTATCS